MSNSIILLKLVVDGRPVEGTCQLQGYEKLITLSSCSWSASAEHTKVGADQVRTELRLGQLRLGKFFDKSSMALYRCVDERKRFDSCVVTVLSPTLAALDGKPDKLMQLELVGGGTVAGISTRTGGGAHAIKVSEDFQLSFKDIKLSYYPLDAKLQTRKTELSELLKGSKYS